MIAKILSKLFSSSTLAKAIALNKTVVSVNIISTEDLLNMADMYQDQALNIQPYQPRRDDVRIH